MYERDLEGEAAMLISYRHAMRYSGVMVSSEVLEELFNPLGECLTPEVAGRLVALRAPRRVQARIDELADKCSDGTLTPEERVVYESYLRAINFIGVLQAKARRVLADDRHG
jgi:hypothetical protein